MYTLVIFYVLVGRVISGIKVLVQLRSFKSIMGIDLTPNHKLCNFSMFWQPRIWEQFPMSLKKDFHQYQSIPVVLVFGFCGKCKYEWKQQGLYKPGTWNFTHATVATCSNVVINKPINYIITVHVQFYLYWITVIKEIQWEISLNNRLVNFLLFIDFRTLSKCFG